MQFKSELNQGFIITDNELQFGFKVIYNSLEGVPRYSNSTCN